MLFPNWSQTKNRELAEYNSRLLVLIAFNLMASIYDHEALYVLKEYLLDWSD